MSKRGVIIANTGTPDAPEADAVRTYLTEFLQDPRICPLPAPLWKIILHAFILPKRSKASAEKYQSIWTPNGSPLKTIMISLAQQLQAALGDRGEDVLVRAAMSYGSPSVTHVIAELREQGCEELVILPLYPQSALSTSSVVFDKTHAALASLDWHPPVRKISNYCTDPLYSEAIANTIHAAGFNESAGDKLLFAFHSIPMKDIRAGDTYAQTSLTSAEEIARALNLGEATWEIGFQCRFDKARSWLSPFTTEALQTLGAPRGRLFVVAPNFSIDCLETLYDIDNELRQHVREDPALQIEDDRFVYVPCLNDTDAHVKLLQEVIGTAFSSAGKGNGDVAYCPARAGQ